MIGNDLEIVLYECRIRMDEFRKLRELGVPVRKLSGERETIRNLIQNWVKRMRDQDYTYDQIKDILNDNDIMTFTGKRKWDGRDVWRIEKGMKV